MEENKEINFVMQDAPASVQPKDNVVEQEIKREEPKKIEHTFSNFSQSKNKIKIKIIGIGGAGCNVIRHINDKYKNVTEVADIYALNTDAGSLQLCSNIKNKFLLNEEELKGYGSGSDPEVGRQAVIHDSDIIKNELRGSDIIFIIAGLGKGAGSGGAPELAKIAKELGILTISIVNMPCIACEGNVIFNNAMSAKQAIIQYSDSVTTISNERIISNKKDMSFYNAYSLANDEIANDISDIIEIISKPTQMNIDFADIRSFFTKNKFFMMTRVGFDSTNISETTMNKAIVSKIKSSFTDIDIKKAKHVICNILMSKNTPTTFVQNINRSLAEYTHNDCISMSTGIDYTDSNQIRVSFLISGNNSETDINELTAEAEEAKWHEPTVQIEDNSKSSEEFNNFLKSINEAIQTTEDLSKKN